MSIVYIKLPKTGLGNKLLVWAKGRVFAKINELPVVTSSWWGFQWGALIRREKKSRMYAGYFKETSLAKRISMTALLPSKNIIHEPPLRAIEKVGDKHLVFLFTKVITNEDLFCGLRDHQEVIVRELYGMLTSKMRQQLENYSAPLIGVHIRRGDFKIGNQTTPLEFFIKAIVLIRQTVNEDLPVTVFTDAHASELKELLLIPNIFIAENKPDILDILLLSKSKIMVLSKSSTFGYWAAFLSNALVIRPHYDWQELIKSDGGKYKEIKWNSENSRNDNSLKDALREIFCHQG